MHVQTARPPVTRLQRATLDQRVSWRRTGGGHPRLGHHPRFGRARRRTGDPRPSFPDHLRHGLRPDSARRARSIASRSCHPLQREQAGRSAWSPGGVARADRRHRALLSSLAGAMVVGGLSGSWSDSEDTARPDRARRPAGRPHRLRWTVITHVSTLRLPPLPGTGAGGGRAVDRLADRDRRAPSGRARPPGLAVHCTIPCGTHRPARGDGGVGALALLGLTAGRRPLRPGAHLGRYAAPRTDPD